ncbi:MAG: S8 family serine peptidase [Acetobacter sp.]|nr:S8 family serine peptidase [Bacteroides sp.]MCM1340961.1 S8 family serine peptidase [Acetobacter sp.]MCM1432483.1 S8 family serine peptidase [Clostridiales bacterium]
MKKFISIILTLTMFTSVIYPCQSVLAQEKKLDNILSIGQDISEMCAEYDEDYIDKSTSSSNEDKIIYTRLIVKTDDPIDEYGAIDSIYGFGYAFLQYTDDETAEFAKKQYETSGYAADYDSVITTSSTSISTGSNWSDEWAYEETDAAAALDYYKLKVKSNINIAILDSGINYNHELFKNRVVRTKADFSTNTDDEMDKYGHGTKVAGAIAKSTPSNVKLYGYKVLRDNGTTNSSMLFSALEYIKQLSNKPDIISCSFEIGSGLGTAVDELVDMGVTVVAAAGNEGKEVYNQPAIFDSVITVAATNPYGNAWESSNYGSCVDIAAPGVNVYTADFPGYDTYTLASGTSLATPLVSAAAAYILMENKKYTPEQVKQELIATATPFKKSSCYYDRYGAGIINFSNIINGTRCKDVTANYVSGAYRENISVELKCANTLVDIYYTTDGTLPTETNGTKYTAPIDITDSTRIIAAAFARAGTPMHSKFTCLDYYILEDDESEFVIDNDRIIKAYLGNETNVVVPDVVNGIVPTQIGSKVFSNSNIENIVLPDSIKTIGNDAFSNSNLKSVTANGIENLNERCFYGCNKLADIDLSKVRYIGSEALSGCELLNQDLELPLLDRVGDKGLAGTYFKSIKLPNCIQAGDSAFENCTAKDIVLNTAETIGNDAFNNCKNLINLYVPNAKDLSGSMNGCTKLEVIFAPKITYITLSIPNNTTIYCSEKLTGVDFPDEYTDYIYTFISPEYTPGLNEADRDGYTDRFTRVNSDKFASSKGGQIRTRDNGLRFGFEFDESNIDFDFGKYAENIDYGFVYTFDSLEKKSDFQKNLNLRANKNNVLVKYADKRNVDGTVSTYNAVFTGIPVSHYSDKISARAYVYIDGMYFYSPVTTRSFNDVATKIIADDEIDQNTKNEVKTLLGEEV